MKYPVLERMFKNENPQSIFEIGVGGGGLLKEVSDHFGGIEVGGIDVSKVRMENTKNVFPNTEFLVHDLNDPWPIPDNSYDIVFSVGVLMYIFDPIPVIQEMLRVAKDKIIMAEFHKGDDEYGGLLKYKMPKGVEVGIYRNYEEVFKKIGKEITIVDLWPDKAIIKCPKFQ